MMNSQGMQEYNFVYLTSYNECDEALVIGLRDAFARAGKTFAVLGYVSKYVEHLHRRLGIDFINLRSPGRLRSVDWHAVGTWEDRFGMTLREFTFAERYYYLTGHEKLARRVAAVVEGFKRIEGHVRFGCIIHKLGAEIVRRCAMEEARLKGVRTVILGTFPAHFPGRMYLHGQLWSERDLESPPAENSEDQISFDDFRALLERIRDRSEVIRYPLGGNRKWSEAARFIVDLVRNGEYEFLDDLVRRRIETWRFRVRQVVGNRLAGGELPPGQYYFFPLHVFDDSQITVRNPEFFDQAWIIEYICRVLPHDVKLVVKLHPGVDGAVPFSFLQRVRKLDNLVLLRGAVNAHEVIKRSSGVIVINSTVALEALLHRKPVLVLGRWAFGKLGLTSHVDDWRELPKALLALRHEVVDADRVDRILYRLFGEMWKCSYNRLPIDYDSLAGAIMSYAETGG